MADTGPSGALRKGISDCVPPDLDGSGATTPDSPMFTLDSSLRVTSWNSALRELTGYEDTSVIDSPISERMPERMREEVEHRLRQALNETSGSASSGSFKLQLHCKSSEKRDKGGPSKPTHITLSCDATPKKGVDGVSRDEKLYKWIESMYTDGAQAGVAVSMYWHMDDCHKCLEECESVIQDNGLHDEKIDGYGRHKDRTKMIKEANDAMKMIKEAATAVRPFLTWDSKAEKRELAYDAYDKKKQVWREAHSAAFANDNASRQVVMDSLVERWGKAKAAVHTMRGLRDALKQFADAHIKAAKTRVRECRRTWVSGDAYEKQLRTLENDVLHRKEIKAKLKFDQLDAKFSSVDKAQERVEEAARVAMEAAFAPGAALSFENKAAHTQAATPLRVVFPYESTQPDECSLAPDDIVEGYQEVEGWWRGKSQGKEGTFPANCVEVVHKYNDVYGARLQARLAAAQKYHEIAGADVRRAQLTWRLHWLAHWAANTHCLDYTVHWSCTSKINAPLARVQQHDANALGPFYWSKISEPNAPSAPEKQNDADRWLVVSAWPDYSHPLHIGCANKQQRDKLRGYLSRHSVESTKTAQKDANSDDDSGDGSGDESKEAEHGADKSRDLGLRGLETKALRNVLASFQGQVNTERKQKQLNPLKWQQYLWPPSNAFLIISFWFFWAQITAISFVPEINWSLTFWGDVWRFLRRLFAWTLFDFDLLDIKIDLPDWTFYKIQFWVAVFIAVMFPIATRAYHDFFADFENKQKDLIEAQKKTNEAATALQKAQRKTKGLREKDMDVEATADALDTDRQYRTNKDTFASKKNAALSDTTGRHKREDADIETRKNKKIYSETQRCDKRLRELNTQCDADIQRAEDVRNTGKSQAQEQCKEALVEKKAAYNKETSGVDTKSKSRVDTATRQHKKKYDKLDEECRKSEEAARHEHRQNSQALERECAERDKDAEPKRDTDLKTATTQHKAQHDKLASEIAQEEAAANQTYDKETGALNQRCSDWKVAAEEQKTSAHDTLADSVKTKLAAAKASRDGDQ
eukprot:g1399.t1